MVGDRRPNCALNTNGKPQVYKPQCLRCSRQQGGQVAAALRAVFNMSSNRYVYTANGGWVDMVHFVFYAGRATTHKAEGDANPVGSAVQEGFHQELMDTFKAPWSAYSYEDLPSDRLGAIFGAQYFDPTSFSRWPNRWKYSLSCTFYPCLRQALQTTRTSP